MPVYNVQMQGALKLPYGPKSSRHELHEDLVYTHLILQRGSHPRVLVLDVVEARDGLRCFGKIQTGPTQGSTGWFPFDELEPSDYEPPLPHDRWSE